MRPQAKRIAVIAVGCVLSSLASSVVRSANAPKEEWKAPARADRKKNPIASDEKSVAAGKTVYVANCQACHGKTGKGDGPAAHALERSPGDLSSKKAQEQSDGALFWKITEGRKPMPTYEKTLNEEQRWNLINYVRTLAAAPPEKKS